MYSNDLKTLLLPRAVPTMFPSLEGGSSQSTSGNMEVEHNYCVQPVIVGSLCHRETGKCTQNTIPTYISIMQ
jgi:hypothetical protein